MKLADALLPSATIATPKALTRVVMPAVNASPSADVPVRKESAL